MIELFRDTYEDQPKFVETTQELWAEFSEAARKGDYWGDYVHWLEAGKVLDTGAYELDPDMASALVVGDAVDITVSMTPAGYGESAGLLARYIRNPAMVTHGIIETGVSYYVPSGSSPRYPHISIEDHLSWISAPLIHVGVDPVTDVLATWVFDLNGYPFAWVPLAEITFPYDEWFTLRLRYDTRKPHEFEIAYESSIEQISVRSSRFVLQGMMPSFMGLPGFNFYAGPLNLPGNPPQTLRVDNFYALIEPKASPLVPLLFWTVLGVGVIYLIMKTRK